jgi:hypothetical protein
MRARMAAAAGLALAGLMLASCSGDDVPGTLPDVTPTTDGPQETTSATPTGDPTAALEAEITAFFEEYDRTIDESWTSTEALARRRDMFADSCAPCRRGFDLTQNAHDEGLTLDAEFGSIREVRLDAINGDVATLLVVDDVPAARLINSEGQIVQEFPATFGVQIAYQVQRNGANGWLIIASDVLSFDEVGSQ